MPGGKHHRQILVEISQSQQHLSRLLWLCTLTDAKLHRVWIATRARLNTADRVGHLMCEIYARLTVVGLVEDGGFDFPLDQRGLAMALGYSPVHLNRAVQSLRAAGLLDGTAAMCICPIPRGSRRLLASPPITSNCPPVPGEVEGARALKHRF